MVPKAPQFSDASAVVEEPMYRSRSNDARRYDSMDGSLHQFADDVSQLDHDYAAVQMVDGAIEALAVIRLDEVLENRIREFGWPDAAASVFANGHEIAPGGAGERVFGERAAILDTDRFHLGSCTKAMTAILVGRFIDADLIQFESSISSVFPDMQIHESYEDVMVGQLLRHEAGTPRSFVSEMPSLWS